MKSILDKFIGHDKIFKFGDILLFQEYVPDKNVYAVSKPILAVYIKTDVYDQTIGFDYIKWQKDFSNKQAEYRTHIEWSDEINILGHWNSVPPFRTLLRAYRKYEKRTHVDPKELYLLDADYLRYKRKMKVNKILI